MKRSTYVLLWTHRFGTEARVISSAEELTIQGAIDWIDDLFEDYEGPGRTDGEEPREDEGLELIGPLDIIPI